MFTAGQPRCCDVNRNGHSNHQAFVSHGRAIGSISRAARTPRHASLDPILLRDIPTREEYAKQSDEASAPQHKQENLDKAAFSGAPSGLSADEKVAYEALQLEYQKGIAYGFQMGLRSQTLYGIADSPIGLAAYFLDHDARSYALISRVFAGESEGLTRDDILDNITIAWLTNTALSGARLYWENWGKIGRIGANSGSSMSKASTSRLP